MSVRATRWLLFAAFALALPVPMLGPFAALVPALRYAILLGAATAMVLAEGAAGPVPWILLLLAVHLLGALALSWLLAGLGARLLASLEAGPRRALAWVCAAGLLGVGILFEIYQTGFGRAPTSNWFGLLG